MKGEVKKCRSKAHFSAAARAPIGTVTQTGREDPVAETILTVADFSPNRINGVYDNKMYLNHLTGRRMYGDAGA